VVNENNFNRDFEATTSLKDYIALIRQNLTPIILITLSGLIVAIIYAINAKDIYEAKTSLKLQKPQGSILEAPIMPEFSDFGNDRFIANEIEVLKSYSVREIVANSLIDTFKAINEPDSFYMIINHNFGQEGDTSLLRDKHSIIKLLKNKVSIEQKRGLDIVEITVQSPSAFEAALVANDYARAYMTLNLDFNRQQVTNVKNFLAKQRVEKQKELLDAEMKLKNFQEQNGLFELSDQAQALIDQISNFEAQKNSAKIDLEISKNSLEQLKKELKKQDPRLNAYLESFSTEPYLKTLQEQIAELEARKDVALATASSAEKTTLTVEYDKKIENLKNKLNEKIKIYKAGILAASPEEIKDLTKKVLEEEIKYQAAKASFAGLSKVVAEYEKKFNDLPKSTLELARLTRRVSMIEKLYLLVEEKYQEALINEQSTPGNVQIIDKARRPFEPAKPNRKLIVIIGLILGGGFGLGFAFVKNYFDNTVKTPDDIQNRNMNVLAWIPLIGGIDEKTNKEFEFIVAKRPDAIPSEAFRALRTRIQFSKVGKDKIKTILITSSAPKEGKTTVTVNLAGSFALANKKTVIVDADLRKPRVHNIFNAKRYPGFTDYFFGQVELQEIIRKSNVDNLHYVTAGTIPPNPSEILGSEQMEEFLGMLKKEYDIVILDSPPIIAVTDSEILSKMVDASILVVSANQTETDLMEKSVEILSRDNDSFIGVLLNRFSYKSGYGSYYKYYYYYSRPRTTKTKKTLKT
jgi:tyrosine-protein kinase Etk/Wzc